MQVPLTVAEFFFSNPGELMPMQGTTGKNLVLWGAISYEQGHYTSLVRTTGTSNEWLVVTICVD